MSYEIKDGAVFIADVHINENRQEFIEFLEFIKKNKPPQLFLVGDIFDLLIGKISYTEKFNKRYIDILNKLSENMEIFYFEGNHDFFLSSVFPNIKIFPLKEQPVKFSYKEKNIFLSHGDIATPFFYQLYTAVIRDKIFLNIVSKIDRFLNDQISKKVILSQKDKFLCKNIENFYDIVKMRLKKLNLKGIDIIIEGHFHQGKEFEVLNKKYINLPSFACNKSFFIVQSQIGFKKIKL